jgi:hypothetical protein
VSFLAAALAVLRVELLAHSGVLAGQRYCYLQQPWLVWTNLTMDGLIAISYGSIFLSLFWVAGQLRAIQDLRTYLWILIAFGTFIVVCGATHLMKLVTVWWPVYPLSAVAKVICAAASVPTAILFARAFSPCSLPPRGMRAGYGVLAGAFDSGEPGWADSLSLPHRRGMR